MSAVRRRGESLGSADRQLSLRIAEITAELVSEVLAQTRFGLLTVFGGDTLAAIVRAMGRRPLTASTGDSARCHPVGSDGRRKKMWLITKAGGFGPEDVLRQIKESIVEEPMTLAITMGDSNGVGPEIILNAYRKGELPKDFVVVGDYSILSLCNRTLTCDAPLRKASDVEDVEEGAVNTLDLALMKAEDLRIGEISGSPATPP